ncbi:sensor histidine kinase [Dinoroseobacter sp. S124A]|uniref:sensor histidine kinase n=1 Tax=Dinoroseobacter sp. S124A TaxID=3415128 RepID=UPI003C79A711
MSFGLAPTTSIRRRLLTFLLTGAAATAIILYFVVQSVAAQLAQESQDNILTASAVSIVDNARVRDGEIMIDIPYFAFSMLGSAADERVFYAIWLGDEFLSGYDSLPRPEGPPAEPARFDTLPFLGEEVRLATVARPISLIEGSSLLQVSIAQTRQGQRAVLTRVSRLSLGIGAGFFALTALLAIVVASTTIRPVNRLTGSLSRRGPSDLREVTTAVPREMAPLVATLNSFMTRLKTSLARSEDFIAEAAHRVRTPLAIVRTQAEILHRRAETPEARQTLQEMMRAVDETSRTAGQLLDHATVSFRSDSLESGEISLQTLAREAAARARPISELKDIEITVEGAAESRLRGDLILMQSAVANILDNAIKYTPAEGQITLSVDRDQDRARLRVTDTGPGFPDADPAALTGRFVRGSNAAQIIGSGLGLTIADEVARVHGGQLILANSAGGGACVTLSFPLSGS